MKKALVVLMALLLAFPAFACTAKPAEAAAMEAPVATEAPTPTEEPAPTTVQFTDINLSQNLFITNLHIQYFKLANIFLLLLKLL